MWISDIHWYSLIPKVWFPTYKRKLITVPPNIRTMIIIFLRMGKIKREQERVSHFLMLKQMKKKYPKAKFTKHAYDKHRRLLAELPERWLKGNRTYATATRCWRRLRPTIWAWKTEGCKPHQWLRCTPCKKQWPNTTWATLTREFTVWRRPGCLIQKLTII